MKGVLLEYGQFNTYRNPLHESEFPLTEKVREDLLYDFTEFLGDVWSAFVKTLMAYIVIRYVLNEDDHLAVEVALLLGAADMFTKRRNLRVVQDVRKRFTFIGPGGQQTTETEHDHTVTR